MGLIEVENFDFNKRGKDKAAKCIYRERSVLRKFGFSREQAYAFADNVMCRTNVLPLDEAVIRKSAEIAIRQQISNWVR